jgi:hypothetical protein
MTGATDVAEDHGYEILRALARKIPAGTAQSLPALDHEPTPWESSAQATGECLSWRGTLDNLERRHREDRLGDTVYADSPVHARSVLAIAHSLLAQCEISERELIAKMNEVRTRFARA